MLLDNKYLQVLEPLPFLLALQVYLLFASVAVVAGLEAHKLVAVAVAHCDL
jgi:hypothetical protein